MQIHKLSAKFYVITQIPGLIFMLLFLQKSTFSNQNLPSFTLFDDAMISMGYAKTFAETGELVWFAGADKVQGFTNLLWTLWMALLHLVGLSDSSAAFAVSATSILLITLTAIMAGRITFELTSFDFPKQSRFYAALVATIIPFLYPLTYWSLRGMETGLLSFLLLALVSTSIRLTSEKVDESMFRIKLFQIVILGSLGILTRIDFFVPVISILLIMIIKIEKRKFRFSLISACSSLILVTLAILTWQYLYYGDFLTNTYRLKVDGFSIYTRITRGIISSGKFLPLLFSLSIMVYYSRLITNRQFKNSLILSLGAISSTTIYAIWAGGDAWEFMGINRYLSITLPLITVMTIVSTLYLHKIVIINTLIKNICLILFIALTSASIALTTNPFGIREKVAFGLFGIGLGAYACFRFAIKITKKRNSLKFFVSAVIFFILLVTNITPFGIAYRYGFHPYFTQADFQVTNSSKLLRKTTFPGATLAVSWAGTPAYYSSRSMIDLLGKSDRYIANQPPQKNLPANAWNSEFYPGHNKFDFEYSIGQRKPDIVVDIRNDFAIEEYGYYPACLMDGTQIYVLVDSKYVNEALLKRC